MTTQIYFIIYQKKNYPSVPLITLEKLSNGYNFIDKMYDRILVLTIVTPELYSSEFLRLKPKSTTDTTKILSLKI